MGLQAIDGLTEGTDLLAGPFHPAFGELVHSALWLDAIRQGIEALPQMSDTLEIRLNTKLISRVKGQHKENIATLAREFSLLHIHLMADDRISLDRVLLNGTICQLPNIIKGSSKTNDSSL